MNPKAANVQTLTRLDAIEAQVKAASEAQSLTISDVRDTIHSIAAFIADLSQTLPAILEELQAMAALIAKLTEPAKPAKPAPATAKAKAKKTSQPAGPG